MKVHPLADLFPMMDQRELEALAADIKANGQREAIAVDKDDRIVDGRNRWKACEIAGVSPTTTIANGDASSLIVSANIMRRHMRANQIAILAVCAELEIELPRDDTSPSEAVDAFTRGSNKYDWQRQAHRRVEKLVSAGLVNAASHVIRWAPDHARMVLDTGDGWNEARRVANERSKAAHSEEARRAVLAEQEPELLAKVDETFTLDEAWRTREARIRQERETRVRLTKYLVDRITPLLDKSDPAELVEHYDPDVAGRKITIADFDQAIAYLKDLRAAMVRAKKGSTA